MAYGGTSCASGLGDIEINSMKVLIFTSQIYRLGGAEKLAIELAEGLNSQFGVQADVLVMGFEDVLGTKGGRV